MSSPSQAADASAPGAATHQSGTTAPRGHDHVVDNIEVTPPGGRTASTASDEDINVHLKDTLPDTLKAVVVCVCSLVVSLLPALFITVHSYTIYVSISYLSVYGTIYFIANYL